MPPPTPSWGALLLAAGLAGCTADRAPRRAAVGHAAPVYGGRFLFAAEDDLRTLDPAVAYDETSGEAERLVFDSLVEYDADVRLVPALAASWELDEGGRVYTFHLRPGVRFHHGRPVVAQDVVASWNRLFEPSLASPGTDFFRIIAGADAVLAGDAETLSGLVALDAETVQVTLDHPDATFLNVVAMPFGSVIPVEEARRLGDRFGVTPVGTGPFRVETRTVGEKTVFARNEDFWREGLPSLPDRAGAALPLRLPARPLPPGGGAASAWGACCARRSCRR